MIARFCRARGTLDPWVHAGLWLLAWFLVPMALGTAYIALELLSRGEPVPWAPLAVPPLVLALLLAFSRRHWFLRPDLQDLVERRGGTRLRRVRRFGRDLRARIGDLWLLARLDHPIAGYFPARRWRARDLLAAARAGEHGDAEVLERSAQGAHPRHMLTQSQVSLVRLGDFARLAPADLRVTKGALPAVADPSLADALRDAAEALTDPDLQLAIELRERWFRVEVRGGSWLGAAFGPRIDQAIGFAQRLGDRLAARHTPLDPDRYTVEPHDDGFRVVETPVARTRSSQAPRISRLLGVVAVLVSAVPLAARATPLERASSFLAATQLADGSWSSTRARSTQATAEALRALQVLGGSAAARTAAAGFLAAGPASDSDDLARRLEALRAEGRDVSVSLAQLIAAVHPGGAWGLTPEFQADVVDTALALAALSDARPAGDAELGGLSLLIATQNADGGWGCVNDASSDLACTAQALLALVGYRSRFYIDPTITEARAFLSSALNPDGSFGFGGERVYETAVAARALLGAGDSLGSQRLVVVAFLEAQQDEAGGWGADALLTAVAARALDALVRVPVCGDGTGVPFCGDGVVNLVGEECDRADLAGMTCSSLGLLGGTLSCNADCTFHTASCTGTGQTSPHAIVIEPSSLVCAAGSETVPVSIAFPEAAVVDKVDVFFLFDDTGSFAGRVPTVTSIFMALVNDLQAALPGISLGFGVGRFEDYGGSGTGCLDRSGNDRGPQCARDLRHRNR